MYSENDLLKIVVTSSLWLSVFSLAFNNFFNPTALNFAIFLLPKYCKKEFHKYCVFGVNNAVTEITQINN